tara:strand:+ start:15 stop:2534 length:2520 start_codon:yes stop_codon:yes gene_type:complete
MKYSTDIKDYYRRAWGLKDRPGFKYGGSWADWATNYSDQMTFEEYLQDDNIVKKPHFLDRKADGGRIGFDNGGLSVDLYNTLYDEYAKLIEQGIKNEKLIDIPSWDKYIKSKNISPMALKYYAGGEGIRINPTTLLQNKKIELAEKIIAKENAKLNGAFKRGNNPPKGKLHVAELFRNKVVGPSWSLGGKQPGMNTLLNNLINTKLDTRADKIRKAFKLVTSPEYELSDGIRNEIARLMGESKDMFDAGKLKSPYGPNPNEVWEELIKPYEYVDEKTGKTKNLLKTINHKINKLPKGTDTTFSYLLELAENDRLGKAGIEDWWKMAGDKPEQWAMRQVDRAWKNNDPRLKVYDLNGKPITWEAGKKISSDKVLFEYVDEKFPQYKNKLYSFYKPKKITGLNYPVYDLSTQIRTLPEWKELVEVVDGKNKLKTTEMINPFTGEKSTYQKVYEDIYSRVETTQATTKKGYSRIGAMGAHIDHDFGQAKGLFNNLRLSTGQQNQLFKTLMDAAENNKALKPYIRALESEVYKGGSINDQIKAIVKETDELGKVVKNTKTKITMPTATEMAAYKFLKNEIPDLPESVLKYLRPKAAVVEKLVVDNKLLGKWIQEIGTSLSVEDTNKLSTAIQSIMSKKNSGLNVVDIAQWGKAELSALDDIAGKLPSKALGVLGNVLKVAGVAGIPLDAVPFTEAHSTGLTPDVGAMNLAEIYSNLPGMIWEAGEWAGSKLKGKEHEWKPPYEFEFGRDYETKKLQDTPIEVLEKRVDRWATDMVPQENLEKVSSYLDRKGIPGITDENVQLQQYEEDLLKKMREKKAIADQKKKEEITGVDKYIINRFNPNV